MKSKFSIPYQPSNHEKRITEFFGNEENLFVTVPDKRFEGFKFYFVCFMNRSGSNYLSELIASDNRYCKALENLNFEPVIKHSKKLGYTKFVDYLYWLVTRFATKDRVYGVKISWDQLFFLTKIGVISNCFFNAKFLHIERQDIISQAISFLIADQTKQWTSRQLLEKEMESVTYNEKKIHNLISGINNSNTRFKQFFSTYSISPISVCYENLVDNPEYELALIYKKLNFFGPETHQYDNIETQIKKQANHINEDFKSRFKSRYTLW